VNISVPVHNHCNGISLLQNLLSARMGTHPTLCWKKGTGLDIKLHAIALNWEEQSVANVCQSGTFQRHRSRAPMYNHGAGAERRESPTVPGRVSTETLDDDLTPEDFHRNIWSTGALWTIYFCEDVFSRSYFAFLAEPNVFQRKV